MVPHEPSTAGWKTLVALGPLARSVADARLMLTAVAGFDRRDRHSLPQAAGRSSRGAGTGSSRRFGRPRVRFLDDDVRQAFRATVDRLADAGVQIVEDTPGLHTSVDIWSAIALAEACYAEHDEFVHHRSELGEGAAGFIEAGSDVTAGQYIKAQFARERIHRAYVDLFERTGHRSAHSDPGVRGVPAWQAASGHDRQCPGPA